MENMNASLKKRIDNKGFFVCDEFTNEVSDTLIDVDVPEGLYKPKWDGSKWVEGDEEAAQKHLKEQQRSKAKADRDKALNSITYTLDDGSVYQVRPQDVPNFQLAIQRNVDVDWILADNTIRTTTVAELQEILDAGIQEGIKIWDAYTQKLKEIG